MIEKKRILKNAGIIQEAEYDFKIAVPEDIMTLFKIFRTNGKKLYIVGGAVRDAVDGIKPHDFDVATDATPDEVMLMLKNAGINCVPKGKSFGVVSAFFNNTEYEIATFRAEDYSGGDGRRPTSLSYTDLNGDANRRDLTLNAMYYDIAAQKIIDPVGGYKDLKNRVVRTVGHPHDRFNDDELRVMRFIRFANQYGTEPDEQTIKAITHFKELPRVSNERIFEEIQKGLKKALRPEKYLTDLNKFGILTRAFGNINLNMDFIPGCRIYIIVFANILKNNDPKTIQKSLTRLTVSNHDKRAINFLILLKMKFEHFDNLVFDVNTDGYWLTALIDERDYVMQNGVISYADVMKWAKLIGLNTNVIHQFMAFNITFSAKDFPELPQGRELGAKIAQANAKAFLNSI